MIKKKFETYFQFTKEIFLNLFGGTSLQGLLCEIVIRKLKDSKIRKKFLVNSIKSFQIRSHDINEITNKNHFSEKLKNEIEEKVKPNKKTIVFLKHLMLYHLWFGSFVNCQYSRDLFRKNIIIYQEKKKILDLNAVRAVIELNKLDLLKTWFKEKKFSKFDANISNIFLDYLKINSHRKLSENELLKLKMIDLVQNKKIIVIGPAPDDELKSLDILNEYDLTVGPNYVSGRDMKFNISYYVALIKKVEIKVLINSFKDLDFACIASQYLNLIKSDISEIPNIRGFREELLSIMLIFKSRPNLIPDVILDLIKHNPKKIYLCGTNFFLGKKTYREKSFTKFIEDERKKNGVIKTLRAHDPFANFAFLKNVWTNGLIEVSEDVKSIISLTENEFSQKLDNLSNTDF